MKLLFIPVSLISFLAFNFQALGSCQYNLNINKTKISWVAFKTPKKIGVKAAFDKFSIKPLVTATSSSIEGLINGASFEIESFSINSTNIERDTKLKNFFFSLDNSPISISGKVLALKKNQLEVEFNINGSTKKITMESSIKDNLFTANGKIDVLDFALGENLKKINEACKDLHEGKTWSDVEIKIESEFDKKC